LYNAEDVVVVSCARILMDDRIYVEAQNVKASWPEEAALW
jgi:hypothetical protein